MVSSGVMNLGSCFAYIHGKTVIITWLPHGEKGNRLHAVNNIFVSLGLAF